MIRRLTDVVIAIVVIAIAACYTATTSASEHLMATPALRDLQGVWRSEAYGWVLSVSAGRTALYHENAVSCLRNEDPYWEALPSTFRDIKLAPDGNGFTTYTTENVTRFHFHRLQALPPACKSARSADAADPQMRFEVFWHNFQEHYAFFEVRSVDWIAAYHRYRPKVYEGMDDAELFVLLSEMLEPLNDRHVALDAGAAGFYNAGLDTMGRTVRDNSEALCAGEPFWDCYRRQFQPYKAIVEQRYLHDAVSRAANDQITWGMLPAGIAYLRVDRFRQLEAGGDYAAELDAMAAALDAAFEAFTGAPGLVLDIRFNTGGYDGLVLHLAGRFTSETTPGFVKYARAAGGMTEPQAFSTHPTGQTAFTGPVAVLTSEASQSAAENLLLLLQPFTRIRRVGERTASVHSDELYKPLGKGWSVYISNEVFVGPDGVIYEGRGIEPHIPVPYFSSDGLSSDTDPVLEAAMEDLRSRFGR